MFGPILKGEKVTLRPVTREDLPHFVRWFADPDVIRTLTRMFPPSLEEEEEWFKKQGSEPSRVMWSLEVEEGGTPALVGNAGIFGIDWIHRHGTTGLAIGNKEYWGRGIATEAMRLRTAYAFRVLNLHKLSSNHIEGNIGSRRAQEHSGYRQCGVRRQDLFRDGQWHNIVMMEVLRSEWEELQG